MSDWTFGALRTTLVAGELRAVSLLSSLAGDTSMWSGPDPAPPS